MNHSSKKSLGAKAEVIFGVLIIVGLSAYFLFHKKVQNAVSKSVAENPIENPIATTTPDNEPKEELLGKAEVSFAGGTDIRNKNIELGISKINGTVVKPGEEFSFTKTLGSVTEEEGYGDAKIFQNNEVVTGVGGGLCQVSTTLFQSIVKAGLPVTERHNHTFTVSYYDVGLDATYADPGPDLKFVNDTQYPLTIIGTTTDQKAKFEIYGVPDGRTASTSEPVISDIVDFSPTEYVASTTLAIGEQKCFNAPQIGYTATVLYGVEYPDGTWKGQTFVSKYKPLQHVCYFGATSTLSRK